MILLAVFVYFGLFWFVFGYFLLSVFGAVSPCFFGGFAGFWCCFLRFFCSVLADFWLFWSFFVMFFRQFRFCFLPVFWCFFPLRVRAFCGIIKSCQGGSPPGK